MDGLFYDSDFSENFEYNVPTDYLLNNCIESSFWYNNMDMPVIPLTPCDTHVHDKEETLDELKLFESLDDIAMMLGSEGDGDKEDIDEDNFETNTENSPSSTNCNSSYFSDSESVQSITEEAKENTNYNIKRKEKKLKRNKSNGVTKKRTDTKSKTPNAIMAKLAREKKKQYIKSIEANNTKLTTENKQLNKEAMKMKKEIAELNKNVSYYKNILQNESMLAKIVGLIATETGICLKSASFTNIKQTDMEKKTVFTDHSYVQVCDDDLDTPQSKVKHCLPTASVPEKNYASNAGICLHVKSNALSLELCSECNYKSNKNLESAK